MFKILVAKSNFFSGFFGLLICIFLFFFQSDVRYISTYEWLAICISLAAYLLNSFNLNESLLLKNINYNLIIILIFIWIGVDYLKDLNIAIAFLCVTVMNLLMNLYQKGKLEYFFVFSAILLFIANFFFYPSWAFTFIILLYTLVSSTSHKAFWKFLTTFLMCILLVIQILYITDHLEMIKIYTEQIHFSLPEWKGNFVYFIPSAVFIFLAISDHFINSHSQSLIKRNLYNLVILLFILLSIELLIFNEEFDELLIFLYFPVGIFYGRFMSFIKNPYLQNLLMLLSFGSLVCIKLFEFNLL